MKSDARDVLIEKLIADKKMLREEIQVSRRASDITAELVVGQFAKAEEVLLKFQEKAAEEKELRQKLSVELDRAIEREHELDCERKRLQDMQISAINMMEDIALARKLADAANKAKSEFLANMSHEIRTPMNGVIGIADILMETEMSSEQKGFVRSVQSSADSLLVLINDILDYSKIEAGKLDMETIDFDLRTTMEDLSDLIALKAEEKGLEFVYLIESEVPTFLKGDPSRMRQILINLTGNSIKFTENGEVVIHVSLKDDTDTHATLLFKVIDTGIGIPIQQQDRLFKTFSQVDSSTTRKYGGTGLGLAISKQLVDLMDGEISVESEEGKGATFWFTVVLEKQEICEPAEGSIVPKDIEGKRILVVDDSRIHRKVIIEILKAWDLLCEEAGTGQEAIDKLNNAKRDGVPYHIALIDLQMEDTNGEVLGSKIKEDPELHETSLILVTSIGQSYDSGSLDEQVFKATLTKPVKQSSLLNCISNNNLESSRSPQAELLYNVRDQEQQYKPEHESTLRILIAEDNKVNQMVVVTMLKKAGHSVFVANNGKEAVAAYVAGANLMYKDTQSQCVLLEPEIDKPFDLILMDGQMPVMSGIDACKEIRKLEASIGAHIPIIAVTANAMKGDREKFLEAGMDDYISKPIKKKDLYPAISRCMENSGNKTPV